MTDEYIRKQDAVDVFNHAVQDVGILDADDIETVFGMLSPADVAPVVHGKWVDHDGNKVQLNEHGETCGTCFCNRCGEWLVASDEYAVKGYFCPNCGAKMDREE